MSGRIAHRGVLFAIVPVLLGTVSLSGCGGGGREYVEAETIVSAVDASLGTRGFRFEYSGSTEARQQVVEGHGSGTVDLRSGWSRSVGTTSGGFSPTDISNGRVSYTTTPELERELGRRWARHDFVESGRRTGIDPHVVPIGLDEARRRLEELRSVSGKVEKLGSEEVGGTRAVHYRARVDLRKVPSNIPAAKRAAYRRSMERVIANTGADGYAVDVWVDPRGLVRRLLIDKTSYEPEFGGTVRDRSTIVIFAYDRPVTVRPPRWDQVKDLPDRATSRFATP